MSRPRVSRLTAEQRSMLARLAAQRRWAQTTDRAAATRPARDALAAKWARSSDPESAKRAHMTAMSLASSRTRKSA